MPKHFNTADLIAQLRYFVLHESLSIDLYLFGLNKMVATRRFLLILFLMAICPGFFSPTCHAANSTEYREITAVSTASYHPEDKQFLKSTFIDVVNTWLRRYEPQLISQDESTIQMRANYGALYDIGLEIKGGTYKLYVRLAEPVWREARAQKNAEHLTAGISERIQLALSGPEGTRQLERDARAQAQQRRAQLAADIAAEKARIVEIKQLGDLRAYSKLASFRYEKCQGLANIYLDTDVKKFSEIFESGLESIRNCSKNQEIALADEVKLALLKAPTSLSDQIKDLHAYTIASLRALTNFYQSAIEARQARSERAAGIDERTTRVELEL